MAAAWTGGHRDRESAYARDGVFAECVLGFLVAGCSCSSVEAPSAPGGSPISILAVGDIAQCGDRPAAESAAARTGALIEKQAPDLPLLLLGDLVDNSGTPAEYRGCYEPTYGKFRARSFPAPGNHDHGAPAAGGYYAHFGARTGPAKRGCYSFDLGSWHIVSLNSNTDRGEANCVP